MVNKIILEDWTHTCGDGCCVTYGTKITINGKECENDYAGDSVEQSLEFILKELGIDFEIEIK